MTDPKPENVDAFKWAVFLENGEMTSLHRYKEDALQFSLLCHGAFVRPVDLVIRDDHRITTNGVKVWVFDVATSVEIDEDQTP